MLTSTSSIVAFINVFTSLAILAEGEAPPTFTLVRPYSVDAVLFTATGSPCAFIYIILAAGALESGRTDTPLGVAVHTAAPIQAGRLAAPTVHAACLGMQLLPSMTTLVFRHIKSSVILFVSGEVLGSSFVADAPLPRLATVGFPDLGYPGEGLPAGHLHQPGLHVLVRTDIRHSLSEIVRSLGKGNPGNR